MSPEPPNNAGAANALDTVLAGYMRRLDRGEPVDKEAIIALHPELATQLRAYFSQVAAFERVTDDATVDFAVDPTPSGSLEVRCPTCCAPMSVASDTALTDLTCKGCGSQFSLINQNEASQLAPPLAMLGRFELIGRLGMGAFGTVWKARDKELDRTVAIKIPRATGMTPEEQEKFFREARAAAQLRHPSIVSVHEVGRDGDSVYIVSDFVRGVTLADWLTGQKVTNREAAELCAKIADALHHAHEQGVVHRDLKPANIMIDGEGQPHLMDFGLARREVGETTVTVDGQILGTPAYMSPEQAAGESHLADRRSDVYSLGVMLFQLLTGELPFRGNLRMIVHQVIHDEPPGPRKLNSNVPRDLDTITLKCMEKIPARRYPSAAEMAAELRRYLSGEPIQARPISRLERGWRWAKRKPMMATTAALVVFLAIAGPLAAIMIDGQRRELATRYAERNNLIAQKVEETKRAGETIQQLRGKLDVWEGRANPWEFWPPKENEPLRKNIATDLLQHSSAKLAEPLRSGKYAGDEAARGYLALGMLAAAVGQNAAAREHYQAAHDALEALWSASPAATHYAQALGECCTRLAQLAESTEPNQAAEHLKRATTIYQQLAAQHQQEAQHQIDWLESEWTSSKTQGFGAAQSHFARVADIRNKLPNVWPSAPDSLYRLACILTQNQPILSEPITRDEGGATSENATAPND